MADQELVEKLKQMLRELFQFENNDLDFGIYRIINIKRKEISDFIEKELFDIIKEEIQTDETKDFEDNQKEGMINEYEEDVYNNIITFFSRYYDNGDFVSKRRYSKKYKYIIPFNGEEIYYYWTNSDQYYIKTTEKFNNFSFKVDHSSINFKVSEDNVDIEKNNVKDNENKFFIFHKIFSDGTQISFGYRGLTEGEIEEITKIIRKTRKSKAKNPKIGKDDVNEYNIRKILQQISLLKPELIETLKKKHLRVDGTYSEKSELEWYLNKYTTKHNSDYFIHKDLKKFLINELDFYVKNEMFPIDLFNSEEALTISINIIKIFLKISLKIIEFLAQVEDFQKRIWEKKKFVTSTEYCITLDLIDEKYYPQILKNKKQIEEWKKLFSFEIGKETKIKKQGLMKHLITDEIDPVSLLKEQNNLLLDTKFYDSDFKYKILSDIDNLEENITGILINSENFHALNLLLKKYHQKIKCCYIDPPFNTGPSEILYKNNYKQSSYLSLMENRLSISKPFLSYESCYIVAIDDYELINLTNLLNKIMYDYDRNIVIVKHHPQGSGKSNVSRTHEYALFFTPFGLDLLRGELKEDAIEERSFQRSGTAENNFRYGRPNSFYAILVDPITFEVKGIEKPPEPNDMDYSRENTEENLLRIYPISTDGQERVWRNSYETAINLVENNELICTENKTVKKVISHTNKRKELFSIWDEKKYNAGTHGTTLLTDMFGETNLFSYPKSVYTVLDCIQSITYNDKKSYILDFFAGSGTTGHAVLKLNRKDNGKRKFFLIEMAQYFETVLKPRILKSIYSDSWKNGIPQKKNGSKKQIIKCQKLEQYEDSLNNIDIVKPNTLALESKDYKIKYMLNFETKDSNVFLNIDLLDNPFDYKLDIEEQNQIKTYNVDLIETFNYLAGIFVDKIIKKQDNSVDYIIVKGNREEKKVIVIWRNKNDSFDPKQDKEFVEKEILADDEYDEIFVNGSSLIEKAISLDGIFKKSMLGE